MSMSSIYTYIANYCVNQTEVECVHDHTGIHASL